MSILFRYFAKEIFQATLLLLMGLLALFALFDLIKELGDLGKSNYGLGVVLAYVTLSQPAHVAIIFPVAALMGTIFAIARLSSQSELTVMRASGLSLAKLAGFATVVGLIFSVVMFLFGEFVAPAAEEAAKRVRMTATSNVVAQQFRSGFWIKDDLSFVNIQSVTIDTELVGLRIYDFDSGFKLKSLRVAKRAAFDEQKSSWVMQDVEKTVFTGSAARIEKLPRDAWATTLKPKLLAGLRVKPDDMSLLTLSAYIERLRTNKENSTRYEIAFWGKIFQPATVIIMMLLAIPFAIQSHRSGGLGAKLLMGIMLGLVFVFLNQLAANLTLLNDWPPLISSLIPLATFFCLAFVLLMSREYACRLPRRLR